MPTSMLPIGALSTTVKPHSPPLYPFSFPFPAPSLFHCSFPVSFQGGSACQSNLSKPSVLDWYFLLTTRLAIGMYAIDG